MLVLEKGKKLAFENPSESADFTAPAVARHQVLGEVSGLASVELCPSGNLDIEVADDFKHTFVQMLESDIAQFFVNLGEVSYVDSSGLGSLMQLYRETKTRGGRTWFYGLTPPVQDIFSLTRLDKAIDLYETRQDAFAEAEKVG